VALGKSSLTLNQVPLVWANPFG